MVDDGDVLGFYRGRSVEEDRSARVTVPEKRARREPVALISPEVLLASVKLMNPEQRRLLAVMLADALAGIRTGGSD